MATKQLLQVKAGIMPKGIGIGWGTSIAITILGAAVSSWLLVCEKIGESNLGYVIAILLLVSSAVGALVASSVIRQKRILVCLISGSMYFLSMLGINALFFQGVYSGVGESALLILGGSFSVALLGLNNGKKPKRKKRK